MRGGPQERLELSRPPVREGKALTVERVFRQMAQLSRPRVRDGEARIVEGVFDE